MDGDSLKKWIKRKLLLSVIFSVLLWIFIPAIIWILGKPEISYALKISVWLIPSKAIFSFVKTALQAGKEFFLDSAVDILSISCQVIGIFYSVEDRSISSGFGTMELYLGFTFVNNYCFAESTGADQCRSRR